MNDGAGCKLATSGALMSCSELARESRSAKRDGSAFWECSACERRLDGRGIGEVGSSVIEAQSAAQTAVAERRGVDNFVQGRAVPAGVTQMNNFPVLHKVVQNMLVSLTTGCYRNDFVDDNFSAKDNRL